MYVVSGISQTKSKKKKKIEKKYYFFKKKNILKPLCFFLKKHSRY